jgi:hypothetical protein
VRQSYRAVAPWSATTGIPSSGTLAKVSGTRDPGSVGYRIRNTGLVALYVVEARAGAAAPADSDVTAGRYVGTVAAGSLWEGGLSEGDVYCLAASSTGSCQFQEVLE